MAAIGCTPPSPSTSGVGHFDPPAVDVRVLADGRKVELLGDFSYIDASGDQWTAPVSHVVDGASIPQAFWSLIGGPYEGKYRYAAVIHDRFCDIHAGKTWKQVHRMFYEACLAGGVDPSLAKLMYGAVYHFGPRWSDEQRGTEKLATLIPPERQRIADALVAREKRLGPTTGPMLLGRVGTPPVSQNEYRDILLAPRPQRILPAIETPANPILDRWDRIRALVRDEPFVSLERIEQTK